MIKDAAALLAMGRDLLPEDLPRHFVLLSAVLDARQGGDCRAIAKGIRTTEAKLKRLLAVPDAVQAVFGVSLQDALMPETIKRPRAMLGQLVLGELAERAFESIYKRTMGTEDLILEDDRKARSDTDYRVLNGQRRPVFRLNIKFHGTLFQKAKEMVGLESEDCFALATYKIYSGLQKHEEERLPYVFAIVSVPGVTTAVVADAISRDLIQLASLIHATKGFPGKRSIEERIVRVLLASDGPYAAAFDPFRIEIGKADWRVISARRADQLLRERLFERVYAVRVRAFARNYKNAELDMHFSLKDDLTPLPQLLENAKKRGIHGLSVDLERGTI